MDIRIKGDMDGTETARVLRERFNIPVIYLTAHADTETVTRAKASEPLGYITKPFQEAELHASIEIALHKHREDLKFREKERLLSSTLRAMAEGVVSIDPNEVITLFNPAAEAWTGWKARDALGKTFDEVLALVDSATGEKLHTPLWRVLAEGSLAELPPGALLISQQGEKRPVTGSMSPIRDHKGEIAGAVVLFGRTGDAGGLVSPPPADDPQETDGPGTGTFKMIAASPSMKQTLKFARRVAQSEVSTILLEGESGTGKDVLAQFIHHYGRRSEGPFVALNCAAIPETLLESELFGYEKGAFTDARAPKAGILEMASGGTIFLDEIGEMPSYSGQAAARARGANLPAPGRRARYSGGLRVVAATNRKLSEAIEQGTLPAGSVLSPQRDPGVFCRPSASATRTSSRWPSISSASTTPSSSAISKAFRTPPRPRCSGHDWPGNVRELRNVIERAMVLEEADWIQASSLQISSAGAIPGGVGGASHCRRGRKRRSPWRKQRAV